MTKAGESVTVKLMIEYRHFNFYKKYENAFLFDINIKK